MGWNWAEESPSQVELLVDERDVDRRRNDLYERGECRCEDGVPPLHAPGHDHVAHSGVNHTLQESSSDSIKDTFRLITCLSFEEKNGACRVNDGDDLDPSLQDPNRVAVPAR